MALPGITKVRAEARHADDQAYVAERALINVIRAIPDGLVDGHLTPDQLLLLRGAAQTLTDWQAKAKRLWDEVDFMEQT
jgi:hypothetical protein